LLVAIDFFSWSIIRQLFHRNDRALNAVLLFNADLRFALRQRTPF
jgi:hypothetical protein